MLTFFCGFFSKYLNMPLFTLDIDFRRLCDPVLAHGLVPAVTLPPPRQSSSSAGPLCLAF
jgi:hypothetical protein